MITPLHHSDYTLKNRAFNCRMRNRYYEEVYYAFRAVMPLDAKGDIDKAIDMIVNHKGICLVEVVVDDMFPTR